VLGQCSDDLTATHDATQTVHPSLPDHPDTLRNLLPLNTDVHHAAARMPMTKPAVWPLSPPRLPRIAFLDFETHLASAASTSAAIMIGAHHMPPLGNRRVDERAVSFMCGRN
jgi:hypothetical protein